MRWSLVVVLLVASVVPILVVDVLPLHDYPVHLARMEILTRFGEQAAFSRTYTAGSLLLPNVAYDAAVLLLSGVMPVEAASRLFVAVAVLLCGIGLACLQRALFGELSVSVLLGVLLTLNGILKWGFINYIFGLGLMLVSLAVWITIPRRPVQLVLGTIASLALLFSHLVAFGLYALCILGWELDGLFRRRWGFARVVVSGVQFVPAVAAFLLMRTSAEETGTVQWVSHPAHKLEFVIRSIATFVIPADLLLVLAGVVVGVLVLARVIAAEVHGRARLMLGIVLLAFLVLPFSVFGSYFLDARIPIAFFLLLAAATRLTVASAAMRRLVVAALAGVCLLRIGAITNAWHGYQQRYAALDFAGLGPGDMLFSAGGPRQGLAEWVSDWQPPMTFATAYAAASGAFVPAVFADPRHQPLVVRPEFVDLYRFQDDALHRRASHTELLSIFSRVRELNAFERTFVLVRRCHKLDLQPGAHYQIVFARDRECLLRIDQATPLLSDAGP